MSEPVRRILDAAIEGQARSPRHIQNELSRLHAALVKDGLEIRSALKTESKHSTAEVEIQYALALETVARCFAESNLEKALHAEFSLSRGENAQSRRTAYPVAYIVPSSYNFVYSCVTAVATAISAGCCIILEASSPLAPTRSSLLTRLQLPKTLSRATNLVQNLLSSTLDRDTFAVADKRIELETLPKNVVRVFGSPEPGLQALRGNLVPPSGRSIAIVDRTADMHDAASAVLRARFSFGGKSPIAPDLVLVNEFRVKEFCSSVAELTSKYFAAQIETNGTVSTRPTERARTARVSSHELDQAGAEVLLSGSSGSVVRVNDRKSKLLRKRIQDPLLVIHPVRSIDDAIDLANADGDERLSAAFAFGTPEVVKYISQFVDAHLCCANKIPVELLVGPATPTGFATSLEGCYTKEMFSVPSPTFVKYDGKTCRLQNVLDGNDLKATNGLRREAEALNTAVNQPAGHAIGFFEQGILLGLGMVLTSIVAGNVVLWRYGLPAIRRRLGG